MEIEIRRITPAWAAYKLEEANMNNRTLRPRLVSRIAEDIRDGNWQLNGETVKFTDDLILVDGQHRLAAVVEAGIPVEMAVAIGVSADHQVTVDTGAARTFGDVLKFRGETSWSQLAAAVRLGFLLDVEGSTNPAMSPSNHQLLDWLELNPSIRGFLWSRPYGVSRTWTARMPSSVVTSLDYLFTRDGDADASEAFWTSVLLGEGEDMYEGNPAFTLRRQVLHAASSRRATIPKQVLVAITIKAWNSYVAGEAVKLLRWVPRYENRRLVNFPEWAVFPSLEGEGHSPTACFDRFQDVVLASA